jgi:signal transduction histidine kinase
VIFPVWPEVIPDIFRELLDKPVIALMFWSYFQFIRHFLDVPAMEDFDKKIKWITYYLVFFFVSQLILDLTIPNCLENTLYFNLQCIISISLSIISLGIFLSQRKAKLNNFMIPAVVMIILGTASTFILFEVNKKYNLQLSVPYLVLPHQIMTIFELALFTGGVSMKAYLIEKENLKTETLLRTQQEESHHLAKEIMDLKTAFASDLHDDVGASLSSIDIYANVGLNAIQNKQTDISVKSLESINHVVRQSLENMRDTLWLLDKNPDTLGNCFTRWLDFAAPLLNASKIKLQYNWPEILNNVSVGIQVKRDIFLILKEATNNIIRHSNASEATLKAHKSDGKIIIQLTDNGSGFEFESGSMSGNGLLNMQQRLKDKNGKVTISSRPDIGTSIKIELQYD